MNEILSLLDLRNVKIFKTKIGKLFLTGMSLGFLIWLVSPHATEKLQPWATQNVYYLACLTGAGILMGFLAPRHRWVSPISIYCGQVLFLVMFVISNTGYAGQFFLALAVALLYVIPNYFGSILGGVLRRGI